MLEAARVQAERMVQRTEVVRAAEQRARQVMETAETDSPPAAPRDRGLPRPAPRQLRDPARQAAARPSPPAARRCRSDRRPTSRRRRRRRGRPDQGLLRPGPLTSCRRCVAMPRTPISAQRRRAAAPARVRAARRDRRCRPPSIGVDDDRAARATSRSRRRSTSLDRRRRRRTGRSSTPWRGQCRRCLTVSRARPCRRRRAATRRPVSDDRTRSRSSNGQIDLAPLVRETVLLGAARRAAVPARLRRLCPTCGIDLQPRRVRLRHRDDRWAVLAGRRSDEL